MKAIHITLPDFDGKKPLRNNLLTFDEIMIINSIAILYSNDERNIMDAIHLDLWLKEYMENRIVDGRMKTANYFADNGIKTIFTVVGGGAMHMNDSFGHHERLQCVYNHHEQASAMAAEAYFRVNNEMAGLCVTSGPGAINALNGVAGAYQDSIPMIVVSGQTKTSLMTINSGLDLRTLGNQEFDIMSALSKMTKYAETLMNPTNVRYMLEKAFYLAKNGRPGPCWIEVPLDIQGAFVETENLVGYDIVQNNDGANVDENGELERKIRIVIDKIKDAKRPIIYAGNGVRISGAQDELIKLASAVEIPVVTCWDSIDLAFELATYGLVSGILSGKMKKDMRSLYISLIISMLAGRLVWGLVSAIVYALMGSGFTWKLFFMGGFVNAIPGIVIQLILIPVLVNRLYAAGVVKPAYEGK